MCCSSPRVGLTRSDPVVLGDPGGQVHHVHVVQPFYGLWAGPAWVTGTRVTEYVTAGLLRLI